MRQEALEMSLHLLKVNNTKMKFTAVILFALLVGALGYSWEPEEEECVKEQKVDKAWIETVNNPLDKPTPENEEKLNNFLECTWKKQKLLTDSNTIDWEKINELITKEVRDAIEESATDMDEVISGVLLGGKLSGAIDKCQEAKISGSTTGQTVAKVQNCIGEKFREVVEEFQKKAKTT